MEEIFTNHGGLVVNLEPNASGEASKMDVATYEQAFLGEPFSNLKGKGRARRQARKLDRVAKKEERKTAKVVAKSNVKDAKGQARIGRRADRKQARQVMRNTQQSERQGRKDNRVVKKTDRRAYKQVATQDRRDMRSERKAARRPEEAVDQYEENYEETYEEDGYAPDDQYEEGYEEGYSEEEYYPEDENYSEDEYGNDPSMDTEETYGEDYYDGYDPDQGESDESYYEEDYYGADGGSSVKVPKNVQDICNKIEFNNELISRFKKRRDAVAQSGEDASKFNDEMAYRFDMNQQFEQALEGYSSANGIDDTTNKEVIRAAKGRARRARLMIGQKEVPDAIKAKLMAKGYNPTQCKEWWLQNRGNFYTPPVSTTTTTPSASPTSGFDGDEQDTTAIEVDLFDAPVYNYDQPQPVIADIYVDEPTDEKKSGFGGSSSSNLGRNIVIGLVVGAAIVYVVKKYKLLK